MSTPNNPLDQATTYSVFNILIAFPTVEMAENADISILVGAPGTEYQGGMVIVNEFVNRIFTVTSFKWSYMYESSRTSSTATLGTVNIVDKNTSSFLTFLKDQVSPFLNNISVGNMVFAWKTFYTANNNTVFFTNPLYFTVGDIFHNFSIKSNFYSLTMLPLYNTKAQMPNYSRMENTTITHNKGELHEKMPQPTGTSSGIIPRGSEDNIKLDPRTDRINLSKPMTTLQEAFDALELELNQRAKVHKGQLQKWLSEVEDDYTPKIKIPPEQEKELPITYEIDLDGEYATYTIDNRNLPFEQPEQNQEAPGVRAIPVKKHENLLSVIDKIMEYSKQSGEDADPTKPQRTDHKTCLTWMKNEDGIHINIKIRKFIIPKNIEGGVDTGPGEGESAVDPLTFFYNLQFSESGERDVEILEIVGQANPIVDLYGMEENSESSPDSKVVYTEREGMNFERDVESEWYENAFSGHFHEESKKTLGVEYPKPLYNKRILRLPPQYTQQSFIKIKIRGNPALMSDLCRKPSDVIQDQDGQVYCYKLVETYPLYAKLKIEFAKHDRNNIEFNEITSHNDENLEEHDKFYHYESWMHIYEIQNIFESGTLYQVLYLLRTDDLI